MATLIDPKITRPTSYRLIASAIDDRQPVGNYATISQLNDLIARVEALEGELELKQG